MVRIVQAREGDLDRLVPLFRGYFEFYRQRATPSAIRRFIRARLRRRDAVLFLATLDGQPAGIAQLYPTYATLALGRAWILYDLFVTPAARGRGVATALLQRAQRLPGAELVLETARTNRSAQRLYAKLGWRREREFLVYRWRK